MWAGERFTACRSSSASRSPNPHDHTCSFLKDGILDMHFIESKLIRSLGSAQRFSRETLDIYG